MIPLPNAPSFKNLSLKPFQVDMFLNTQPVFYDFQALDGLLASTVVQQATRGKSVIDSAEPYNIPLPLEKLWTDMDDTLAPLWNATRFFPVDANIQTTRFWHKRGYRPDLLKRTKQGKFHNANFQNGRHKEYRIPMPVQSALHWRAYAVGDIEKMSSLLIPIQAVGKKRTQGYGRIRSFRIQAIDEISYTHDGKLIKTFPLAYEDKPDLAEDVIFSCYETGWTPPYWLETLFKPCVV